jgi:aminoglycoside phosphotransferase family enzyme/predicted kinase
MGSPSASADRAQTIETHETHGSWVFVGREHALKVKRPVKLPFLDYGTLERRRAMCREEVRLNRRLAPELYLGTVGIVPGEGGGLALVADDEAPRAIEVGVLMRRYDERDTLAARCADGTADEAALRAVGSRLAAFHSASARPDRAVPALAALRQAVRSTLDDLEDAFDIARVTTLRRRLDAALTARREQLLARGRRGLVVDGHGDLRAKHVLLTEPMQIVDALEFDPALRIIDVACDLGFLVMDLEGAGAPRLAAALVAGYRDAGGDPGDDALLGLMMCYRALVRAKVDLVRGDAERAAQRFRQAVALSWRARGPLLLAIGGPPASGKTTLARALCEESGMLHVSSDVVRKARLGLAPTERAPLDAYSRQATTWTYRALGERAASAFATGRGAVVDATLGDPAARAALRKGLGRAAEHLVYVECRAPAAELRLRARAREAATVRESDATAAVAERLAARFVPLDEVPAGRHLVLRTDRRLEETMLELTTWVDRPRP